MKELLQVKDQIPDQLTDGSRQMHKLSVSESNSPLPDLKRRTSSDPLCHFAEDCQITSQTVNGRRRNQAASCSGLSERSQVAAMVSKEKMAALEKDIFNPVDYCETVLQRMKTGEYKGKTVTSMQELYSLGV